MFLASMPLVGRRTIDVASRLSQRDTCILASTLQKLADATFDFHDAARALHESVVQIIPAGRIYLLGSTEGGPILGSIISGVGITASPQGVVVVRVTPDGRTLSLGSLRP